MFEDKEDEQSKRALEKLEQKYTLGEVNFDLDNSRFWK